MADHICRLFFAVECPNQVNSELKNLSKFLPQARILPSGMAHLTIKFLGDTPEGQILGLAEAARKIDIECFELKFTGLGTFKLRSQIILWAGLEQNESLTALHRMLNEKLHQYFNIEPDRRTFSPHITLARINITKPSEKQADTLAAAAEAGKYESLAGLAFEVSSFGLYQSELSSSHARHTLLAQCPLRKTPVIP